MFFEVYINFPKEYLCINTEFLDLTFFFFFSKEKEEFRMLFFVYTDLHFFMHLGVAVKFFTELNHS